MATTEPPARPWSSLPSGGSDSIPLRRPRHGRCRRMRRCLQDDGCTSSRSAGSLRSTKPVPRWPSSSGPGATRRPASSPTPRIVPAIRAWAAASLAYQDFIFPELTAFKTAVLVNRVLLGIQSIVEFLEDRLELARLRPYCDTPLAAVDQRSQGSGGESIASCSTGCRGGRSRSGRFFAFLNYFDAHYPYQLPHGRTPPFRGRTD